MGEMVRFNMLTVGELSAGLKPKEIVFSEAQEALELEAVTDAGGSFRKAAAQINRYQHRHEGNEVSSRQLDYLATRKGKAIFDMQIKEADAILDRAGINPKTLLPKKDGVLESIIRLPVPEDDDAKRERFSRVIEAFNKGLDDFAQIKNDELILKTELIPDKTVIICLDEIGVDHQRELRRKNGKEPEGKAKSSERVETTSIHIQAGGNIYRMTAPNMKDAVKLSLAFLLEHGLKDGANLLFFFDGARNIRAAIDKYFAFYPHTAYIDWYHVRKKVREHSSSAFSGSFEEKRKIVDGICERLWAGNVDEAFNYIDGQTCVRSEKGVAKLKGYLERKKPFLYCFALRKQLGYRNASSPVEKTNDLAVAQRQKHNGMSWGYQGSRSLASITTLRLNGEFDEWIHTGTIRFGFARAS